MDRQYEGAGTGKPHPRLKETPPPEEGARKGVQSGYTTPCAIIAVATFKKPAMFAPAT